MKEILLKLFLVMESKGSDLSWGSGTPTMYNSARFQHQMSFKNLCTNYLINHIRRGHVSQGK